jgi:hypothetical protein
MDGIPNRPKLESQDARAKRIAQSSRPQTAPLGVPFKQSRIGRATPPNSFMPIVRPMPISHFNATRNTRSEPFGGGK